MLPHRTKTPTFEGTLPPPSVPLDPTLALSTPPQAPTWPPNVWDLIAELTNVVHTTICEQDRIEIQATMMGTHTTSAHYPHGPTTREDHPSKSIESMPSEMLRAPVAPPQESPMEQASPSQEVVMGKH